jgi:hypothetical protein
MKCSDVNFSSAIVRPMGSVSDISKFFGCVQYENRKEKNYINLAIKTEQMILKGGIPLLDTERIERGLPATGKFQTDADRNYITINFDTTQSSRDLKAHLELADEYFRSDEIKNRLFEKKANQCLYNPILLNWNNNASFRIKLSFHPKTKTIIKKNGKIIDSINTVSDICQYVKYGCHLSITFVYGKIWMMEKDKDNYIYGVRLRAQEIDMSATPDSYPKLSTINLAEIKKAYVPYVSEVKKAVGTNSMEIVI